MDIKKKSTLKIDTVSPQKPRLFIIGSGRGGYSIATIFSKEKRMEIVGISVKSEKTVAARAARRLNIPVYFDLEQPIEELKPDIVFNVSGFEEVTERVKKINSFKGEIIDGWSSNFIWKLLKGKNIRESEFRRELKEKESFNKIGIMLLSSIQLEELLDAILKSAMSMANVPAGSIALCDDEKKEMHLSAVRGFSTEFSNISRWPIRRKGITEFILSKESPVAIENLENMPNFQNPILEREGVKSLMAVPLIANQKISGILYLDDFVPRKFTKRDISCMKFLSIQASLAIEKARYIDHMKKMAITDELTEIYNHRHFTKALSDEIERSRRFGHSVSLLMADIDNFKFYNDHNGHLKGNIALRQVAEVFKKNTRNIDISARYGGEEFAVILVESNKQMARETGERIRDAVEKKKFHNEEMQPGGNLTISIGVASFPDDAATPNELIEAADKALYRSKERGRNKVSI